MVGQVTIGNIVRRAFCSAYAGYWVDQAVAGRARGQHRLDERDVRRRPIRRPPRDEAVQIVVVI